jgi:hypothetical protein
MKAVSFNGSPRVGGHAAQKPVLIKLSNRQEITMTQNKQHKDASPATTDSKRKSRIGHWVRVAVMFLSGGFIFPHAMTEDEDIAKYDADKDAKVKKQ